MREALGDAVFAADVLAVAGLDDRTSSGRVLERAQELMVVPDAADPEVTSVRVVADEP